MLMVGWSLNMINQYNNCFGGFALFQSPGCLYAFAIRHSGKMNLAWTVGWVVSHLFCSPYFA